MINVTAKALQMIDAMIDRESGVAIVTRCLFLVLAVRWNDNKVFLVSRVSVQVIMSVARNIFSEIFSEKLKRLRTL